MFAMASDGAAADVGPGRAQLADLPRGVLRAPAPRHADGARHVHPQVSCDWRTQCAALIGCPQRAPGEQRAQAGHHHVHPPHRHCPHLRHLPHAQGCAC